MKTKSISPEDVEKITAEIRKRSNSAQYKKAYSLAKKMMDRHPDIIIFAYLEAVFTAEDTSGFTKAQSDALYRKAAKKLKPLLRRLRAAPPMYRRVIRNEYYWFSKMPRQQYQLGVQTVKSGNKAGHYPMGVGACMIAKEYALKGQRGLALRWAKKSERAWKVYTKYRPNWYNSYVFYGTSLAYQGRFREMDKALNKGSRAAGKSTRWKKMANYRSEMIKVAALLGHTE